MPNTGQGFSRKRKTTPNVTQRNGESTTARPANLPQQYNFTPAPTVQVPAMEPAQQHGPSTSAPHVRNYPPPLSEEVHYNPLPTEPAQQGSPQSPNPDTPANSHPLSQGNNF